MFWCKTNSNDELEKSITSTHSINFIAKKKKLLKGHTVLEIVHQTYLIRTKVSI